MKNAFENIYLKILKESIKEKDSNIDDLTDENITDISEQVEEYDDNDEIGWSSEIKNITSDTLHKTDSLQYEIDNCVKGSFTNCKTTKELSNYFKQLSEEFNLISQKLENLDNTKEE